MEQKYFKVVEYVNMTDLRIKLKDTLDKAIEKPIIVLRNSKPTNVIVSHEQYQQYLKTL